MKITTRCGQEAIAGLNEALLAKASAAKVLKTNRVRADTTVVEANVAYPTDSGLLTKGVTKMARAVALIKAAGLAPRTKSRDRTRQVHKKTRSIAANLRRRSGEAKEEVMAINAELTTIAMAAVKEARNTARNARRALRGTKEVSVKVKRAIGDLETIAFRIETIARQSRQRLSGVTPDGSKRLVSLHDIDARPIRKGRLGKPVEFGYKAQVVDNEDGVVLDHNVEIGNPADAPQLVPAVTRITSRVGLPRAVTADRGYGEQIVADELHALGVRKVVLPTKGKPNAARRQIEKRQSFQKLVKWRTGCEGRISCLKRDFGWNRTRIDGINGARTWCGHGVFNHNLVKIAGLMVTEP
jgi:transposase, IS5 family